MIWSTLPPRIDDIAYDVQLTNLLGTSGIIYRKQNEDLIQTNENLKKLGEYFVI